MLHAEFSCKLLTSHLYILWFGFVILSTHISHLFVSCCCPFFCITHNMRTNQLRDAARGIETSSLPGLLVYSAANSCPAHPPQQQHWQWGGYYLQISTNKTKNIYIRIVVYKSQQNATTTTGRPNCPVLAPPPAAVASMARAATHHRNLARQGVFCIAKTTGSQKANCLSDDLFRKKSSWPLRGPFLGTRTNHDQY